MIARNTVWTRAFVTAAAGMMGACSSAEPSHANNAPEDPAAAEQITVTQGILARLEAKPDQAEAVAQFVEGGLPIVNEEAGTLVWFGFRLGPTTFGIFDAFADEAGRKAHLDGKLPAALMAQKDALLAKEPSLELVEILAHKLPTTLKGTVSVGLVATLKAQAGKEGEMESFLKGGAPLVEEEPETTAWFAFKGKDFYGIFDVFADEAGRDAHLGGKIPAALTQQGPAFVEGAASIEKVDVTAFKLR